MIVKKRVYFDGKLACCHDYDTEEKCIYTDGDVDCIELYEKGKRDRCSYNNNTEHYIFVKRNIFIYLIRKVMGI